MARGRGRARERAKGRARRQAKDASPAGEFTEEAGRAFDRVTLVLTLVGVCAFAIFTGYLVGQYAIRLVAAPLITSERAETPGTRFVDDEAQPSSSQGARSVGSQAASRGATTATSTTSTAPAASTVSSSSGSSTPSRASTTAPVASTSAPSGGASSASGSSSSAQATRASVSTTSSPATSPTSQAARTIHRVQIGRFATRAEASAQAEALKKGNPPVPDAWVLFDDTAGVYRVQAGAFSSEARAREFVAQLVAQGYDAFIAQ